MNVLSLFDGKSSGYTAMELAGLPVTNYYSAEIDKYAIKVSDAIHPNQTRLGDVMAWHFWDIDWASIDLVLGGFPCQAWSMAGKQQGDKDERGMLFWYMLDIMQYVLHHNPNAKFLIENVKMKKEFEEYITFHTEQALGKLEKHLINSALVSAQNRQRYYWTNIQGIEQPEDRGLNLIDIIDHDEQNYTYMSQKFVNRQQGRKCLRDDLSGKAVNLSAMEYVKNGRQGDYIKCGPNRVDTATDIKGHDYNKRIYSPDGKAPTLAAATGGNLEPKVQIKESTDECLRGVHYRKLTPRECFRLQTTPENYIDKILACGVSNTQLYKIAGNGWTDEVIAHIFSYM